MSSSQSPTPFDDLDRNGAPLPDAKYTQPLPPPFQNNLNQRAGSLLSGLQNGAPTPTTDDVAPSPVPPAPSPFVGSAHTPAPAPPVASSVLSPSAPTARLKLLPTPTLIGLAVVGGALMVMIVPALVRRAIPTVPMKTMPPAIAVAPRNATASIAATPAIEQPATQPPAPKVVPTTETSASDDSILSGEEAASQTTPSEIESNKPRSDTSVAQGAPSDDALDSGRDGQPAIVDSDGTEEAAASGGGRDQRSAKATPRATRTRASSAQYEISPPPDWKQRQNGRRSIWQGPRGAQLLVEVSDEVGASPRRDWERLDKALSKKYGRRYRSLGIRETTLAGLPAAAWEFELRSKNGTTTRKLDVAVHHDGRGYAVMGSAPAERFEELRPQLESAIDSFRLHAGDYPTDAPPASRRNRQSAPSNSDSEPKREDDTAQGY